MRAPHAPATTCVLFMLIASGAFAGAPQGGVPGQNTAAVRSSLESPGHGARVRITSGAAVALPGVLRFDGLTPMTDAVIIHDDADTVTVRTDGDRRVKVLRPLRHAVGVITRSDLERLVVDSGATEVVTVPRDAVVRYEVSKGRASRRRNVLLGVLVGGGVGAAIGFAAGNACHPEPVAPNSGFPTFGNCFMAREGGALAGLMIGAGGAAAVGALLPRHERWTTRPLSQLPK